MADSRFLDWTAFFSPSTATSRRRERFFLGSLTSATNTSRMRLTRRKVDKAILTDEEIKESWKERTVPFVPVYPRQRRQFHLMPFRAVGRQVWNLRGQDGSEITGFVHRVMNGLFSLEKASLLLFKVNYRPAPGHQTDSYDIFVEFLRSVPPGTPLTPLPEGLRELFPGLTPGPGGTVIKPVKRETGTTRSRSSVRSVRKFLSKLYKKKIVYHKDHPCVALIAPYSVNGSSREATIQSSRTRSAKGAANAVAPVGGGAEVESSHTGNKTIEGHRDARWSCFTFETTSDDSIHANGLRISLSGDRLNDTPPIQNYHFAVVVQSVGEEFLVNMTAEQYSAKHDLVRRALVATDAKPFRVRWNTWTDQPQDVGLSSHFDRWTEKDIAKIVELPQGTAGATMLWKNPATFRLKTVTEENEEQEREQEQETAAMAGPSGTSGATGAQ